ncbi:hypothetical protein QUF90_02540 [Desulfococcaceae bacterium HSG9]|nr:hypothetical protein [Desulfococcaceae bacterium HSG9]
MPFKFFFKLIILFSISAILINIGVLEWFVRYKLMPMDNWQVINARLTPTRLSKIKKIAVGDSHPSYNLDIRTEDFFNMSYPSENTHKVYIKLRNYIKMGMRPEFILLQADYHLFSIYRARMTDYYRYTDFFEEQDSEEMNSLNLQVTLRQENSIANYLIQFQNTYSANIHNTFWKYITDGFHLENRFELTANGTILTDEGWKYLSPLQASQSTQKRIKKQLPEENRKIYDYLMHFYEKTIRLGLKHHCQVILIKYPLSSEYLNRLDTQLKLDIDRLYVQIANKYDLEIWDYSDKIKNRDFFSNPDHLSRKGAKYFGDIINAKLNEDKKND